jgi:hypothetical protein
MENEMAVSVFVMDLYWSRQYFLLRMNIYVYPIIPSIKGQESFHHLYNPIYKM